MPPKRIGEDVMQQASAAPSARPKKSPSKRLAKLQRQFPELPVAVLIEALQRSGNVRREAANLLAREHAPDTSRVGPGGDATQGGSLAMPVDLSPKDKHLGPLTAEHVGPAGGAPQGRPLALQDSVSPKDKQWDRLTADERRACQIFGWTSRSWDEGDSSPFEKSWEAMNQDESEAAAALGFLPVDFRMSPQEPLFWEKIAEVERKGRCCVKVVKLVEEELAEPFVLVRQRGGTEPAPPPPPLQVLERLARYESFCEQIREAADPGRDFKERFEAVKLAAREGGASALNMDSMLRKVEERDAMARELATEISSKLVEERATAEELQGRVERLKRRRSKLDQLTSSITPRKVLQPAGSFRHGAATTHESDCHTVSREAMDTERSDFIDEFNRHFEDKHTEAQQEDVRSQWQGCGLSALFRHAVALGIGDTDVDAAVTETDSSNALVELIVQHECRSTTSCLGASTVDLINDLISTSEQQQAILRRTMRGQFAAPEAEICSSLVSKLAKKHQELWTQLGRLDVRADAYVPN
eukprot:COSAG01_NODE_2345_length_7860_cov_23.900528_3_plen_529_part_00